MIISALAYYRDVSYSAIDLNSSLHWKEVDFLNEELTEILEEPIQYLDTGWDAIAKLN